MRFTIGKKLGLGFGLLISLMGVTTVIAYVKVAAMNDSVSEVVDEAFPTIHACNRLMNGVNQSLAAVRGYLILGADPAKAESLKANREEAWEGIDSSIQTLKTFSEQWRNATDKRHLDQLTGVVEKFRQSQQTIEDLAHTDANTPAYQLLHTQGDPLSDRILDALDAMIDEEAEMESAAERKALLKILADSRGSIAGAMANIRAYLLSGETSFREAFQEAWTSNQKSYQEAQPLLELLSPSQRTEWDRYDQLREDFGPLPQQLFAKREADDWNRANHVLLRDGVPRTREIRSLLDQITESAKRRKDDKKEELHAASRTLVLTLILTTLGAVAVGSVIALLLSRQIISTVRSLADRVRRVSEGDLTAQGELARSADELGQLAGGFDNMLLNLRDLTSQILSVTENVNSATSQISSSAKQQAAGTKEQAATVQEITSTMQEISQSGAQIVEKAKEVATSAEATATSSKSGIKAVQQTNDTMQGIREQVEEVAENIVTLSEKTQAVGEIIATVTDVAEQSNLLALNATIEAAEAGEEGNRFSVVASEMKNLADQAKECTVQVRTILSEIQKGINTAVMLTEEAVKRVEKGKQQADVSEESIRQMSDTTEQSVQAFQQIIAATNQQQVGFEQVTQGMKDIDQATQQTASGTSQLDDAVVNLSALSQQLKTAVANYRI